MTIVEKAFIARFDELNTAIASILADDSTPTEVVGLVEDMLILSYRDGAKAVYDQIDDMLDDEMLEDFAIDTDLMYEVMYRKYEGKDFRQRVYEYYEQGNYEGIQKVAETESHRLFTYGEYSMASSSGLPLMKTWHTMEDDKVRLDHVILDRETIPLDEEFITFGGFSALAPGMFGVPELDINCRCVLEFSL